MALYPSWLSLLIGFRLLVLIKVASASSNDGLYAACGHHFTCGDVNAGYPFWGGGRVRGCGVPELELKCSDQRIATIRISGVDYRVLEIDSGERILRIARQDFLKGFCPPQFVNSTFDSRLFEKIDGYTNLTFVYGCPSPSMLPSTLPLLFTCVLNSLGIVSTTGYVIPEANGPGICSSSVYVPVSVPAVAAIMNMSALMEDLKQGFEVKWIDDNQICGGCIDSGGACGYNLSSNHTTCYCQGQSTGSDRCSSSTIAPDPPVSGRKSKKTSLGIGLAIAAAATVGIGLGGWLFLVIRRRRQKVVETQSKGLLTSTPSSKDSTTNYSQSLPSYPSSKIDLKKGSTYFGLQVFNYTELEEATDNFSPSKELGEGGFGTVYHGVLRDGRAVAVKRLYENNMKRAEQFMNEIEILARMRHHNLVTLYGCTSRHSRELLLVYEYIPNGTVADHLHGKLANSGKLAWTVRLSIAVETADALAYLHTSDVVHRDVKTNNILLDNKFQVKVADFGLSRLFPDNVTHVSTAPQGTPGYVDPEYYQCYQLTDKSDVYSFGVVLIELISSLQAVDTNRNRHDINLSNMAVKKIQKHQLDEFVDPRIGFKNDYVVRRTATSVAEIAFRCLQQERDMRPTMKEVLEALKKIENEYYGSQKAEVVDIGEDDIGLLKEHPSFSPDSTVPESDKWMKENKSI